MIARLPEFRLETYFSRWEFAARYNLTASDAQTLTVAELLALGTDDDRQAFADLALGYGETWGTDRLRAAVAATYDACEPDDVLAFAGAEEAIYWLMQVLAGDFEKRAMKGALARQPLVDDYTQRVLVAGGAWVPLELFGGHIRGGASHALRLLVARTLRHRGDAKVAEQDVAALI